MNKRQRKKAFKKTLIKDRWQKHEIQDIRPTVMELVSRFKAIAR